MVIWYTNHKRDVAVKRPVTSEDIPQGARAVAGAVPMSPHFSQETHELIHMVFSDIVVWEDVIGNIEVFGEILVERQRSFCILRMHHCVSHKFTNMLLDQFRDIYYTGHSGISVFSSKIASFGGQGENWKEKRISCNIRSAN